MRILSEEIKAVLDSNYGETKDVVVLTIPASVDPVLPETKLYFANGAGLVINGQAYSNRLRSVDSVKFTLTNAPDNAEVTLENVTLSMGYLLTDVTRNLDGSTVEILKAFKVADGSWQTDSIFTGQVKDTKVDQNLVTLSIVSDMSKRGTSVAGRTITQRCIFRFNVNGSGTGPLCGWTTAQPGNATSCDHDLDSVNGCKAHGNQHRFGGVPAFAITTSGNGYDPNGGGGWGGGGWCVHPDTWILVKKDNKRLWVRAYSVKSADKIISLDMFGNTVETDLVGVTKGSTNQIYNVSTSKGYSISCSPTHPIITRFGLDKGTPANLLEKGQTVLVYDYETEATFMDAVESIEIIDYSCTVIILQLEEPFHLFNAGLTTKGGIWSHNNKPHNTTVTV